MSSLQVRQNLLKFFVEKSNLRPDQRRLFVQLANELKDGDAWPSKSVTALRIDDAGELEAFGAEWGCCDKIARELGVD